MRWSFVFTGLLAACAGEARSDAVARPSPSVQPVDEPAEEAAEAAPEEAPEETASGPTEPNFEAPLPEDACPNEIAVRLAHAERELPAVLRHAVAMRSEDGRRIRVVLADEPLARDDVGRFEGPRVGHARFEMDARTSRRRPLEARVLGPPDARRGGLTHVRVVTSGAPLTFGHRDIGRVELTAIEDERVCGRIELDDGFTRVRGAFAAPLGPFPD